MNEIVWLYEKSKSLGIISSEKRWEKGISHHPKSLQLGEFLEKYDFEDCGDSFGWKFGGDGDNGEELLYQLDVFFETLDKSI